jgi:ABC-2 type transport system permease protein
MAVAAIARRVRTAAWLGWQIEANWADLFTFVLYSIVRPLATSCILVGIGWAVSGGALHGETFVLFYVGNAFHEYVTRLVVGMGWVIFEEREEYETMKYLATSPIGLLTYLWGRAVVKFLQATVSVTLILLAGWFAFGLRWDWAQVAWGPLAASYVIGLLAVVHLGFLVAGLGLLLPRAAAMMNEGLAVALYLLCGAIYPIDLLPRVLQNLTLALPFTWWYEAMRRFLLGRGASERLSALSDASLFGVLAGVTAAFVAVSIVGFMLLERRARTLGRIDQTTLF